MRTSRREFLENTALACLATGSLASANKAGLPTRALGKTGVRVPILAMGAGSRFLMYKEEDKALEAVQKALDLGISYIDSADDYGKEHLSEQRIGKAIKGRRDSIFLATKLSNRNGAESQRIVEESLKALQVDRLDLLHIHSLTSAEDLTVIEAKGGVLEQALKLRDQKMTRFIGITCHADPAALKTALERHDFDCTQMALNAGMVSMKNGGAGRGMVPNEAMQASFETLALPVAVRKKMGIIGMKVFAQDALVGQSAPEKLLRYTLSLPVATAVVGMPKLEQIEENVRVAKAFKPLSASEMKEISGALSMKNKASLDQYFRNHIDA